MIDCGDPKFCLPCKTPTITSNSWHVLEHLRKWLTTITCIPWYQSVPEGKQPDGQFGVVELTGFSRREVKSGKKTVILDANGNEVDCTVCKELISYWDYTVAITVKGTRKVIYEDEARKVTASDVLMDVQDRYHLFDIAKLLQPINIIEFSLAESLVKDESECCWENQAEQILSLCVKRESSIAVQTIKQMCVKFCWNEEPTCPEECGECD